MPEFDFGHFHILGDLGRGGMALVYKAVDTRSNETIALKVLYPHLMSDASIVKRFQREAELAARLKHQFIVPVVDFGEHDNQLYIAMRYMTGDSLADLFVEPRSVKVEGIIRILGEIASALDYAHQQGVVHRDLKLQNILLDDHRHAYLSDFGIARVVDGTRLTATGQVAGTPMYMSPEQIRGKTADFRTDIYSFSVMAYLMLTGYYPFTGDNSLSIMRKHVKEFPPVPSEVNSDLPDTVDSILLRGLMKDPEDRYDSLFDMVKALEQALNAADYIKLAIRIDTHAVNPVNAIDMDLVSNESRLAIPPPRGIRMAQLGTPPTDSIRSALLQSDLTSDLVTIFIVDDHQIFRDGIRLLLESADDMTLIGEAESGAEALDQLKTVQPDLILMDIQMPDENGIDITRRIKQLYPDIIILMLTMFEDEKSVFAAMRAGASGYVLKGIKHNDMMQTLRVAAGGGAVFSPRIAGHMMKWFTSIQNELPEPSIDLPKLSQREHDLLALIAAGDDNLMISEKLALAPKLVRNFVSQLVKKLAVTDRLATAEKARQADTE